MTKHNQTFSAWLEYTKETLRLSKAGDYRAAAARDAEGQRLWDACRAEGWTKQEGESALEQADA